MSKKKDDDVVMYAGLALLGFFVLKPILFPAKKAAATVLPAGSGSYNYNTGIVAQPQQSSITTGITNFLNSFKKSDVYNDITKGSSEVADPYIASNGYIDNNGGYASIYAGNENQTLQYQDSLDLPYTYY
jgi:hypothetical protein